MDRTVQLVNAARCIREAQELLLEASERLHDIQRFKLSSQLFDISLNLIHPYAEVMDITTQPAKAKQHLSAPF
jgi:hypothetical protein